jgi:hypothetical protein
VNVRTLKEKDESSSARPSAFEGPPADKTADKGKRMKKKIRNEKPEILFLFNREL